ncbi:conjugal transfer protein [Salmonella enterica]|nr:conjugal transfer protein [Salmonella enterica]
MKVKRLLLTIALTSSLVSGIPAYAGVPVTVVADPQAWTAHLEDMTKYIEQIKHLQSQLQTMERQYKSMTGARGLGDVIDSAYDSNVLKNIDTDRILRESGIGSSGSLNLPSDAASLYDQAANNAATYSGQAQKSLQQAQERFSELTGLVSRVNTSSDPKEIMDLNARINSEQTFLQNEVGKIQVLQQTAQANDALLQQRTRQMAVESSGSLTDVSW